MRVLALVYESDAGPGVFAEQLARRGGELDTWLVPSGEPAPAEPASYDAVISLGSSVHAAQEDDHPWLAGQKRLLGDLHRRGVPLLGVCLGAQLLGEALGSAPRRLSQPEIGWFEVEVTADGEADPVLGALAPRFEAMEWHSFAVPLPEGAVELARSEACIQAYRAGESSWGIQFHAEVTREDLDGWIDQYGQNAFETRPGLTAEGLRAASGPRIGPWNALGRDLFGRFCDAVAARGRAALP